MAETRGLVIAAPASGSGKTFVTLALLRALKSAGVKVASAKVGPDYIDPRFHEAATGRPCPNLDPWAMSPSQLRALVAQAADRDLLVIEGVMGLFDGAEAGGGSTADLAALLGLPVILVVDARRQAQSVAAMVSGFAGFRDNCRIAGVILNRVGSPRHRSILETALAPLDIPVLGALPEDSDLVMPSRHLGLVQAGEHGDLEGFLDRAARLAAEHFNIERLAALAGLLPESDEAPQDLAPLGGHIAIATDEAFAFAYPHILDGWARAGARLSIFSPLAGEAPGEDTDAVFLPGGYPELHAGRLAASDGFLAGLRGASERGALIYGECGGFMVLGEGMVDAEGGRHQMAGLLPLETDFSKRRLHLGYRRLIHESALPWPAALRGHEFHYSTLARQGQCESLFAVADSTGQDLGAMGLRRGNVMGSYIHIIAPETV